MSSEPPTHAAGAPATAIPAFVNPSAGSADAVTPVLERDAAFDVRPVTSPDSLADMIREAAAAGAARIVVSGGDGTIATAAAAVAHTPLQLAVIPGGTLNHFAKAHDLPTDPEQAARVAREGTVRPVDVGYANDHLILNTSSVGAYTVFVRVRERLERAHIPYLLASLLAAIRVLLSPRRYALAVEVDGERRVFRTPLIFIGVGERELSAPTLGGRIANGRRGLHVIIVLGRRRTGLLLLGLALAARGLRGARTGPRHGVESFIVDRFTIEVARPRVRIAVDGELVDTATPVEYLYERDALNVVVPLDSGS
ncbi:MAG TPA: diacylglycerol kinase family protein [Gemmatimonadaceae bacterium]|nr:diacylglycerol kinase family protein [Gemmatimonadaceae bacterium]